MCYTAKSIRLNTRELGKQDILPTRHDYGLFYSFVGDKCVITFKLQKKQTKSGMAICDPTRKHINTVEFSYYHNAGGRWACHNCGDYFTFFAASVI